MTSAVAKRLYRSLEFKKSGVEDKALKSGDRYFNEEYMVLGLDHSPNRT